METSTEKIFRDLVRQEEDQKSSSKMFNEKSLGRILKKVPRNVAIGALTNAELFKRNDLDRLVDSSLEIILPDFLIKLVEELIPGLITELKIFFGALFWKYLTWLPDEEFELVMPELKVKEPGIGYADAILKIDEQRKEIEDLKNKIRSWETWSTAIDKKITWEMNNAERIRRLWVKRKILGAAHYAAVRVRDVCKSILHLFPPQI